MKRLIGTGFYMAVLLGLSLLEIGRTNDDSGSAGQPVRIDFEGTHELPLTTPPPPYEPAPPVRIDFEGTHELPLTTPPPPYEPGPPVRIDFEGTHELS
jgi:hypothetical protein